MVAMHPKQGMFPGIFTHSVHVRSSRKFQGLTFRGMRIYVPSCSTNGQADEEIQQVPESAKTPKTANTFWILLMDQGLQIAQWALAGDRGTTHEHEQSLDTAPSSETSMEVTSERFDKLDIW